MAFLRSPILILYYYSCPVHVRKRIASVQLLIPLGNWELAAGCVKKPLVDHASQDAFCSVKFQVKDNGLVFLREKLQILFVSIPNSFGSFDTLYP